MKTKFDVDDEVYIKGKITRISMYKDRIVYDVRVITKYDEEYIRCLETDNDIIKLEGEDNV